MTYQEAINYIGRKVHESQEEKFREAWMTIQQSRMVVKAPATPQQLSKPWGRKATDILLAAMRLGIHGCHIHFELNGESIVALSQELGITCDVVGDITSSEVVSSVFDTEGHIIDDRNQRITTLAQAVVIIRNFLDNHTVPTSPLVEAKKLLDQVLKE